MINVADGVNKEIVWLDEQTVSRANTERKLLGKICIVFTVVLAIIMLATYIITSSVSESTFIERERFDDPDKFIAYMQSEYDAWCDEGYGNLPPSEVPTHEPNKKWAEIDGKRRTGHQRDRRKVWQALPQYRL